MKPLLQAEPRQLVTRDLNDISVHQKMVPHKIQPHMFTNKLDLETVRATQDVGMRLISEYLYALTPLVQGRAPSADTPDH